MNTADNDIEEMRVKSSEELLMEEARADLEFDQTNIERISLKIPMLQEKYARKMMTAKALLKKEELEYKKLEAELTEYYMHNYSLKIDRRDVSTYLWRDDKWVNQNKLLETRKLMVEYLQTILSSLDRASWNIGNAVKIILWKNGNS